MRPQDYDALCRWEESRLDPPQEHVIACLFCNGKGGWQRGPDALDFETCDVCEGKGEMVEPEEWR